MKWGSEGWGGHVKVHNVDDFMNAKKILISTWH